MAKKKTNNKNKPKTFEAAQEQLEQIIERIESGETGLEQSLEQYEQGMKLIKHCRDILDRAEKKIEQFTVTDDGDIKSDESVDLSDIDD